MRRFAAVALMLGLLPFATGFGQEKMETKWVPPVPPEGWKVVSSKDGVYRWFAPKEIKNSGSRDHTINVSRVRERVQVNSYTLKDGTVLEMHSSTLSGAGLKGVKVSDVLDIFINNAKDNGFTVSEPKEVKLGALKAQEYRLTKDKKERRMVLTAVKPRIFEMDVISTDKTKLDDATANTFLNSLVMVPVEVVKAEAKARAEKEEVIGQENQKKFGAKWTANIKEMTPPDAPVVGMLRGAEFKPDRVEWVGSRLVFRKGSGFFSDAQVEFVLFLKAGESLEGKSYSIPKATFNPVGSPHVIISVGEPGGKKAPKMESFISQYSLILNFKAKNEKGEIPGSIYFCAPDSGKSFLAGTFTATVK